MVIRDFEKQKVLSPAQIADLVRRLPSHHLKGLQTILYKPIFEMRALTDVDPSCKGGYYPEYRAIIIHDLVNPDLGGHIVCHEIGHYVFHVIIGSYVRKQWTTTLGGRPPFTTEYSQRGPVEDFAENYALAALNSPKLKLNPGKNRFMQTQVF